MANEMRDRLMELIRAVQYLGGLEEKVADHLIENGVIIPPCSLHQTLWEITWNKRIEQCKVSSLTQKADGSFKIRISPKCRGVYEITPDKIGKTIFLTKEEAEQKLKEMMGNNEQRD